MKRLVLAAPALGAIVACRSPTQITFDVSTDVPCAHLGETQVTAGPLAVFDRIGAPTSTAPRCTAEGTVGSLVVVPSDDEGALVAVQIVVGVDARTEACASDPSACIVAKRALRFIPHEPLKVKVGLDRACEGVTCEGAQTCVEGVCRDAVIGDSTACEGDGCGDTALGPGGGGGPADGAPPVDATVAADAATDGATGEAGEAGDAGDDSGDDSGDAAPDGEAGPDAADASSCPLASAAAAVVSPIGPTAMATATGLGQQRHLVADRACQYHFFFPHDDGSSIDSLVSGDLVSWSPGEAIPLPSGYGGVLYGDDFAVAYADLDGGEVLHFVADVEPTVGGSTSVVHARAPLQGGHLGTPSVFPFIGHQGGNIGCNQDGPSVLVARDGHAYDATGWFQHPGGECDLNVFRSDGVDDGQTFDGGSFTMVGWSSVTGFAAAHDLLELPSTGAILGAYTDYVSNAQVADQIAVVSSPFDAGFGQGAGPSEDVFEVAGQAWFGDWGLCRRADDDVRVVRHSLSVDGGTSSAFQAARWNGASWAADVAPATSAGALNGGLALVSSPDPSKGMILATVDADGAHVDLQLWTPATGVWSPLPAIARPGLVQSLSGSGCGSARPAVFWTESTDAGYEMMVADVSGYFR
jgi:hypothetical protein